MLESQISPNIKFVLGFEEGKTSEYADKKLEIKEEKKLVNQAKSFYARKNNTARNDRNMENDGFTHVEN